MKSYSSREVIGILKKDGWYEVACVGDHHQFKHPTKKGQRERYSSPERYSNQDLTKYFKAALELRSRNSPAPQRRCLLCRKTRYSYVAVFSYDEDGISIEFPDLPGCLPCAEKDIIQRKL